MTVSSPDAMTAPASAATGRARLVDATLAPRDEAGSFEGRLVDALRADAHRSSAQPAREASEARAAAEQLISNVFIQPILAQLRETAQPVGPFAPGDAERRFGPMLDRHVAERIVSAGQFPLVDRVESDLLAHETRRVPEPDLPPAPNAMHRESLR